MRAAAAARRGGGATNPAVSGTAPTHSSGRRRWSAAAATPSSSTASRAQQPRHRDGIGVVMRRSEARGLGGAHACRRRARAEEVKSRSVVEEPTMFSSRESENGSPGYDWEAAGQTTQCGRATQHAAHAAPCFAALLPARALLHWRRLAHRVGLPIFVAHAGRRSPSPAQYPCAACQCERPGTRQGTRTRTARQVHSAPVFDSAWH